MRKSKVMFSLSQDQLETLDRLSDEMKLSRSATLGQILDGVGRHKVVITPLSTNAPVFQREDDNTD